MPGIFRYAESSLLKEIELSVKLGIKTFALFPSIDESLKDNMATYSYQESNMYSAIIQKVKSAFPDIVVVTDVAMDPYNSDGHDGIVRNGEILNDETLEVLGKMALNQAQAGADIVAPSDMMDGRVGYLRSVLDDNGFSHVSIMSYTAKYASAYYGPFREALDSAPKAGDKKTYQMDYANKKEALLEAALDIEEGADFLMVKPALAYLDIIQSLSSSVELPVAAYNVSGEYAMVKAAAAKGWLNEAQIVKENLTAIKRAGADIILTYHAKQALEQGWLD
jgi:porphobilinogen synthase